MIDPMTIMALSQLVMGAAGAAQKGIASYKQGKEAKELSGLKRPTYMIPEEAKNALNTAQIAYNNPIMTGNTLLNNQIENTTANAVANAGKIGMSGGDQLAALGGAMAQENTAKISAYQNALANKNNLMGTYLGELNSMSGLKEKAFDWNTAQPYLNAMKAAQALKQTSQANAGGALQDIVTGLGAGANTMLQNNTLNGANGRINPLTGGLSDAAGAESQAVELAHSKMNPIDNTTPQAPLVVGQKPSALTQMALKNWNKPAVLNPTKIVTPTGKVFSNTDSRDVKSQQENLIKQLMENPLLTQQLLKTVSY
jgi:hypothetical protein